MDTLLNLIKDNLGLTIVALMSLIQIAPIKINPWGYVVKLLKSAMFGDVVENIKKMQNKISELEKKIDDGNISHMRWEILNFSNSCRNGVMHSREQWTHVIEQITTYEEMCEELHIANGVIEQESKYLRDMYQERLRKNDFL